jgi:glycyl-tRNA synthetase beta chain
MGVVQKGNQRVLRARLNDAKFYFDQDVKIPLTDYVERLKGVIFQSKLGTSYEKVERFTALALHMGSSVGFSAPVEQELPAGFLKDELNPALLKKSETALYAKYVLGRGAMLAKADLTTGVVGEFPKLQGIMGSVYAQRGGEAPEVVRAIVEHYMPLVSGGGLPSSTPGALVSMADKLDTIAGCFAVGLIPTGAQDPYALRRQALGIIAIMLDKNFKAPLDGFISKAVEVLGDKLTRGAEEVTGDVLEFFKERLRNQLLSQGLSFDSIDSVLSTVWYDIPDAVERIKAIEAFKSHPACDNLVVAFKRVSNILKGFTPTFDNPDPELFTDEHERALYKASSEIAPVINGHWKKGEYTLVFQTLASIKDTIDAFFDHVLVMADDESVRTNRLVLLQNVRELYFRIADLSRLAV